MISLSKKSSVFEDSVIRRMTRICNEYSALNLSQGFPDFDPPHELLAKLEETAFKGPHQYAITWGADNFRKALSKKVEHFSGLSYDPQSEITVTCGSTEAMLASVLATLNDGDKVAIFSPFYENYGADAILCGATPIYIPLHEPSFNFNDDIYIKAYFKELEREFNGPQILSYEFSPTLIDITTSNQIITVTAHVTDESGVNEAPIVYVQNQENVSATQQTGYFKLTSGTNKDGIYTAQIEIPKGLQPGEWKISSNPFYDIFRNSSIWPVYPTTDKKTLTVVNTRQGH